MTNSKLLGLAILFLVLVVLGVFYQVGEGLQRTVLSSDYYHENIGDISSALHDDAERFLGEHPEFARSAFLNTFHEEWIEEQLDLILDDLLSGELTATINLEERKSDLFLNLTKEIEALSEEEKKEIGVNGEQAEAFAYQFLEETDLPSEIKIKELIGEEEAQEVFSGATAAKGYLSFVYVAFLLIAVTYFLSVGISRGLILFGSGVMVSAVVFFVINPILSMTATAFVGDLKTLEFLAGSIFGSMLVFSLWFAVTGAVIVLAGVLVRRVYK